MSEWTPIKNLPLDWKALQSPELNSLAQVWADQAKSFRESEEVRVFNDRLKREWAIETGIIEGLYQIDRGTTVLLIERGLEASLIPHGASDRPAEEVVRILKDQYEALEWIFDFVASRRPLSTSYIKELHGLLTRHQSTTEGKDQFGRMHEIPLLKGEYKQQLNNPTRPDGDIHCYCPPEHVDAEMDQLVAWHLEHTNQKVSPEVQAAWLHHRFTQIHPFQDGNGRVARAIASLVLLRNRWFPLVINRDNRDKYIAALENADKGDLKLLVELMVNIQKRAFVRALSISDNIRREVDPLNQVIGAALDRLKVKSATPGQKLRHATSLAAQLQGQAISALDQVAERLDRQLKEVNEHFGASADESNNANDYYFKSQIITIAQKLDYFADTRSHRGWARLIIWEERKTQILIAFHGLGFRTSGIMAASAMIEYRDPRNGEEDGSTVEGPYPLCDDVFQFAYNENPDEVAKRFGEWLNHAVLVGIDQWRRQL